jgi:HPt (histidine-containing phosphotransfer) domain-containing protein
MSESAGQFHRSTLADHPDVSGVLPMFVRRLPGHVQRLRDLHATGNTPELIRAVHQLRGAGKSFGFPPITTHAAALEDLLLASRPLPDITPALEQLIAYIEHIEGYGGVVTDH